MNKTEIVDIIATKAEISSKAAATALDTFFNAIVESLQKDDKVTLTGFGIFSISKRDAREGRNPRTGEAVKIAAKKTPKFSASKGLKDKFKD